VPRSTAAHAGDIRQEDIAHRTAWAAVKRSCVKDDDRWVPMNKNRPPLAGVHPFNSGDRSRSCSRKALQNCHNFLIANLLEVTIEIADGPK
jgi:hypothetical protein